ncbi:MAG: hypothetical protein WCQ49_03010 [Candidatus Saccharibacteria bacterium]
MKIRKNNIHIPLETKKHFPYVTRSLIRLFNEGRLSKIRGIKIEPEYGYVSRIEYKNGTFRVTYGGDLGLNSGASEDLAKDKGFTKFLLRNIGINCPKGEEYLLPWWDEIVRSSQQRRGNNNIKTTDQAYAYIDKHLKYPIYVKPINGSRGNDVYEVDNEKELKEVFSIYERKMIRLAVVEETIKMPDYRIVILSGRLISAYQRIPLAVTGNGTDNIEALVNKLQEKYFKEGRDTKLDAHEPRIIKNLKKIGLNLDYIPKLDEVLTLASVSNLSAGGTSLDVSKTIDQKWVDLAIKVSKNFNLRLCGVDLACLDITSAESPYSVLEVNAAPGLDHYASSGEEQKKIVDDLYVQVLNVPEIN